MRIGINALGYGERRFLQAPSIYKVLFGILKELIRESKGDEFIIFSRKRLEGEEFLRENVRTVEIPLLDRVTFRGGGFVVRALVEQTILPILCWIYRIDSLLCPDHYAPFLFRGKSIVIVHDMAVFKDIKLPVTVRYYLRPLMRLTLPGVRRIIADSENTMKDILSFYPEFRNKLLVLPCAIDTDLFYRREAGLKEYLMKKFDIEPGYILYVGALEERKNILRMAEAYRLAVEEGLKVEFVIVGRGSLEGEIRKIADTIPAPGRIRLLGYLPLEDIPWVYSGALFLLFPTLYEGFGLPVLEAMACGTPVITSKVSSLPEVAGDAAIYVDPNDVKDICRGISTLTADRVMREILVRKGRERVPLFSWRKNAKILIEEIKKG